jgi:ribosomal protein L37AE/L43A
VSDYWDGDLWVCTDCYFAHHYGAHEIKVEDADSYNEAGWYAGESDRPCDREPLGECEHLELADNTCSDHYYGQSCETNEDGENVEPCDHCRRSDDENGIREFDWWRCDGCGSRLGGSRYRLAYKIKETANAEPGD